MRKPQEGFTVSYGGKTYDLPSGDFGEQLGNLFDQNGLPSDQIIVITAPNGDTMKMGPGVGDTDADAIVAKGNAWEANEAAKRVHAAKRTLRSAS